VKDVSEEALEPYRFIQSLGLVARRTPGKEGNVSEEEIAKY
jgi:hypothetical protein